MCAKENKYTAENECMINLSINNAKIWSVRGTVRFKCSTCSGTEKKWVIGFAALVRNIVQQEYEEQG